MEQFVLIPYSVYQSQSTLPRKQKLEQKQEKEEIVPKNFDSIYSAVNARLKTSNNKNIIDLISNSPRNKPRHRIQNLVHQSGLSEDFKRFLNISMKFGVWTWLL